MRRALLPWFVLGAALCVAHPARGQLLSPGELSRAHAAIDGDGHCLECHSSGKRVDNQRCTRCHSDIGGQLSARKGLHGKTYAGKPCGECHVEHRGRDFDLVRWPSGSRDKFDHSLTTFALRGAHAEVSCTKCHDKKNARGTATFLGLSTACASCHLDPHETRFGSDCVRCHNDKSWRQVDLGRFDHSLARFALRDKHVQVQCSKCHGTPPDTKYRGLAFARCNDCHKDPHQGRFGESCTSCHKETGWSDVSMSRNAHPALSILGGHSEVRCASCHDQGLGSKPSKGTRCVACHEPVHQAPFGNDCASCHRRIQWLGLPEEIGKTAHARTAFPLRGRHEQVDCAQCHKPQLPRAQRYRALSFERCADCHKDPHSSEFAARDGGECGPCHNEHGFTPTLFGIEAHASTSFALSGRHMAVPCGACHVGPSPRLSFHVANATCAQCHRNPHGEQFANEMKAGGCAHCHSPVAWNVPNIDHSRWPLTGAHVLAQCGSCHEASAKDASGAGATSYRGAPRECDGCHQDVHMGQFRIGDPVRACNACHNTSTFAIASFDHARLAGYPLDGGHVALACERCHGSETLRNEQSAVRYRLGYRKCADCHRDPHAQGAP